MMFRTLILCFIYTFVYDGGDKRSGVVPGGRMINVYGKKKGIMWNNNLSAIFYCFMTIIYEISF